MDNKNYQGLTIEQQFELTKMRSQFSSLTENEKIEIFTQMMALSMRKENMFKESIKQTF